MEANASGITVCVERFTLRILERMLSEKKASEQSRSSQDVMIGERTSE